MLAAMNLINVRCNACGAPLEIPTEAQYVTCKSCNSQLAVQHTGSSVTTKTISELMRRTEQIESEVEKLRLQNELAALDIEWNKEREKHLIRNQNGAPHEPSASGALFQGIGGSVMGAIILAVVSGKLRTDPYEAYMKKTGTWVEHDRDYSQTEIFIILFGIGVILWGIIAGYMVYEKAARFEEARSRYQSARAECEAKLRELR